MTIDHPRKLMAYDSAAFEASAIIKRSPGELINISGYNKNAAKRYILIFNSATVPADASIPLMVIPVDGQNTFSWESGTYPKKFTNGITVCISTTDSVKTIGSTDALFNAQYL